MAEMTYTAVGNLTADPELRFTQNGIAVANFTVAVTDRKFDRKTNEWVDADTLFLRCSVWRDPADNVSRSLRKGARVIVVGRLKQRSYEGRDGSKQTVTELEVDEIGPSLRYATAQVARVDATPAPATGGGWDVNPDAEQPF